MATGSSFQSSIRQFSVPARLASQTREQREAAEAERAAARKARADALGLAWPRVHKQRAGRPSRQQLWEAALYEAIATDRPFADDLTKEVPLWWRPGLGLVRTIDAVQEDMREAPAGKQAVKQQAVNQEDKQEATEEHCDAPPAKKVYRKVPKDAKELFLEYVHLQRLRRGWDHNRCVRHAATLAPEIFGDLHVDTPRRARRGTS